MYAYVRLAGIAHHLSSPVRPYQMDHAIYTIQGRFNLL